MKTFINIQKSAFKICLLFVLLAGFFTTANAQSSSSKGKDFWLMFNSNYTGTDTLAVYITSDVSTSGTVSVPGLSFSTTFTVAANTVTRVILPNATATHTSGTIDAKGIHVTALQDVTVYGLNYIPFTTDAYLGLPTNSLGTEYIVLAYTSISFSSEFGIVGTVNGTAVTIVQTVAGGGRAAGTAYTITLNQGQVYEVQSSGATDLSGTVITATQPVGVFGANQCANIPGGNVYCDHICEMLPPTTAWGKKFGTVPLKSRINGDTWRFLASENGTVVSINGVAQTPTLNRGQFIERILTAQSVIESNKPILAAQYANGSGYSGNPGDPFMMLIPPLEQFLGKYTVTTVSGYVAHYINVIAPAAVVGSLTLDGAAVPGSAFTPIGSTGFSGAQLTVAPGTHNLNATQPFGVFMYGFNNDDSYGYPGGQAFGAVAVVSQVSSITAPPSGTSPVGISNCFSATVRDQFNAPVPGIRVDFTITGTNPGSTSFAFTDANGIATFCYSGPNAGTDQIRASVGTLVSAPATFIWTPVNLTCVIGNRLYVDTSAAAGGNGASWACAFRQLYDAIEYANNVPSITEIWIADGVYKPRDNGNRAENFNLQRNNLRIVGGFSGNETSEAQSNIVGNPTILSGDVGMANNTADNSYRLFLLRNLRYSGQLLFKSLIMQGGNATDVGGVTYAAYVPDLFYDSCIVQNNYAPTGGAFYLDNSTARYQFCIFQNNSAVYGGVFFSFQSNVSFNRIFFFTNTAAAGGAYYGNLGNPVFKDVLFNRNTANDGGAVYQNNTNATYLNCVLDSNTATLGGGIYLHSSSTARLVNGTLYGNTASNSGGAIYVGTGNPNLMAYNTIMWNNRRAGSTSIAGSDVGFLTAGTPLTVRYSMLQAGSLVPADNGSTLFNNVRGVSPQFRSETNRVGPDGGWFTQDDGLQLTQPSPAVNSGENSIIAMNGLIQDPTDYARIMCGTVDRGAYELQTCMNPTLAEETEAVPMAIMAGVVPAREEAAITGVVANPFGGELQVRYSGAEKATISIVNASGRIISTKANVSSGIHRFDAATWGKGLYMVTITTAGKQVVTLKAIRM